MRLKNWPAKKRSSRYQAMDAISGKPHCRRVVGATVELLSECRGFLCPAGDPVYLVVAENRLKEVVTDLIRIGLDDVAGYATPETLAQYQAEGGRMAQIGSMPIAELRRRQRWKQCGVVGCAGCSGIRGRAPAPRVEHRVHALSLRLGELPKERPIWVYCRTDNRSAIAAALLKRHGYDVTHLSGGFVASQATQTRRSALARIFHGPLCKPITACACLSNIRAKVKTAQRF